jgi:hypothetical protein
MVQVVWNCSAYDVPRAKSMRKSLLFGPGSWEARAIHQAHLAAAVAPGRDEKGDDPLHLQCLGCALSHARSV